MTTWLRSLPRPLTWRSPAPGPLLFLAPTVIWLLFFVVAPYAGILVFSFWRTDYVELIPAFTTENLARVLTDPVVRTVAVRTFWMAAVVTLSTFLLSLPLAYLGAFHVQRRKNLFVALVVAPMWVSYIVRVYSWRLVLGSDGVLNNILLGVRLIDRPLEFLLFSPYAVLITLTHIYLPFMFVSIFSVMDAMPRDLIRAAGDLYASPLRTFVRVVLPLSRPGIAAGIMFVFPLAFGDYITPTLVGGPTGMLVANLIQDQFGVTFNWPFGAALAAGLLLIVLLVVRILEQWHRVENLRVY